jgi:hypothetical protein
MINLFCCIDFALALFGCLLQLQRPVHVQHKGTIPTTSFGLLFATPTLPPLFAPPAPSTPRVAPAPLIRTMNPTGTC